jgi:acyl-[acyl-carrier-protein]-phospholipid O-acyltransferase/long-chain-fatty-acid--[acyl-carrier-protein] ligase
MAEAHAATILMATPTFCTAYIRKCEPRQFAGLRYAVVGAERLREAVGRDFVEKFGVPLLEGYGCTEMSPVVAINAPNVDDGREHQVGLKAGSVGHPLPGVVAKIVDPETGEGPIFDREGLLLVNGPNCMRGYLRDEDRTREAMRDGWYVTGDIATIDEAGFITITDRLSRFSKIGGEMVPHMRVEEAIVDALGHDATAVVTAVPDESKGERLVALYVATDVSPEDLWDKLTETELPRLWLPKRDDLHVVDAIPTLGTGKVDLRKVKQLALEKSGQSVT